MRKKITLFEPEQTPAQIHIGLRTIKTIVAVFLCALVGYFRDQPAFFSMTAAIVCMQTTAGKTIEISFNQLLGTIIGGAFGVGVLWLFYLTSLQEMMLLYYFVCSVALVPIILLTLLIRKPSISAFACVVFLSVAVFQLGVSDPWIYALQRTLDILMGIVTAFMINILLPNHAKKPEDVPGDSAEQNEEPPTESAEEKKDDV